MSVLALVSTPSPLWYYARAAGIVTLLLLTASVTLGVVVSMRARTERWPIFITQDLHKYLSTVFLVFLGVHIATVWLDPFTHFGLTDVLVPFASSYRTLAMGLGIAGAELVLVIWLSAYVKRWIGHKAWRALHYLTYAVFPMAIIHGIATGTDTGSAWALAIYIACAGIVASMIWLRLGERPDRQRRQVRSPIS